MSNRPTTGSVGTVRHLLSRYLGKLFSRRRTVALAAAVGTLAALACGGGPEPTPTPIPLPELTADGAIEAVRDYLSTASYGGDLSCLEVLEGGGFEWAARFFEEGLWVVTLDVHPPVFAVRFHRWSMYPAEGSVSSEGSAC